MAARDGLRRIYGTTEDSAPLPFGDRARKFGPIINTLFEKSSDQSKSSTLTHPSDKITKNVFNLKTGNISDKK
jgi:hypothetical protein